ncbi:hypothetical protein SX4_0902 [Vibrio mimicus SX-4]|nr:hypothetical protein SX4_0902 [Vibrio mimicus SX-4]
MINHGFFVDKNQCLIHFPTYPDFYWIDHRDKVRLKSS